MRCRDWRWILWKLNTLGGRTVKNKMDKAQQVAEMMKLPNLGKVTAERIVNAGVYSPEKLKELGAKEVYLRLFEKEGWSQTLCPCFLYALEGAITGEKWNMIPQQKKKEFKKFSKEVRNSLPY